MIQKKPIHAAPPQLQRMLLRQHKYHLHHTVQARKRNGLGRTALVTSHLEKKTCQSELHQNIQNIYFTSEK